MYFDIEGEQLNMYQFNSTNNKTRSRKDTLHPVPTHDLVL